MSYLTLFKLSTNKEFEINKEYKIKHGRFSFPIFCEKKIENDYYFSTEKNSEELLKFFNDGQINANLLSETGIIKTSKQFIKFLSFKETKK